MLTSLPNSPHSRSRVHSPSASVSAPAPASGAEVVTADGRSLPLVAAALRGTAQGGIARLVLEQRFENPYDETLHVTYRMPLPADGAVSGYAFTLGDRRIVGRVERKREARERFERAIAAGHTAALLEQERADIFTQSIGNLPAREALVAQISIDQRLAWLPEGEWELRFPTVIGPRYVAAADRPEDVAGTRVKTAAGGLPARIQIAIDIRDAITAGRAAGSPSHALTTGSDGVIELGDVAGARLDRDIVVRWPVAGATTGVALAAMRGDGDDCYGLVTIVPPGPGAIERAMPRDLIVLIDTSGSMAGGPLDKAKQVVALLIESLGDADRLEMIEFSNEPRRFHRAPVAATASAKRDALRWLRGLSASGGTEMRSAVVEALRSLRPGAQRQVVIATDGYIGGENAVVRHLQTALPDSCRLHFVGVGSAVNRSLAMAMARAGRGAEVICDLDDDPERAVARLLARSRSPVLTAVELDGSAVLGHAPEAVPDVYAGSPAVAAVKLGAGELVVRGRTAAGPWERRLRVGMPRRGEGSPAIAALFGRERVADLEARRVTGEDTDAEIEQIGLAFQIATRLTPFLAIDERRAVVPAERHEAVPQELPHGTTAAAFGLRPPGGAPPAQTHAYMAAPSAEQIEYAKSTRSRMLSAAPRPGGTAPPPPPAPLPSRPPTAADGGPLAPPAQKTIMTAIQSVRAHPLTEEERQQRLAEDQASGGESPDAGSPQDVGAAAPSSMGPPGAGRARTTRGPAKTILGVDLRRAPAGRPASQAPGAPEQPEPLDARLGGMRKAPGSGWPALIVLIVAILAALLWWLVH